MTGVQTCALPICSNQCCESETAFEVDIVDEVTPERQNTAKRRYSSTEPDRSISIEDDNSDNDVELLQSPFKRNSNSLSPSKRFSTKRIQLPFSSVGFQCTSKKKKQIDKASSNNGHQTTHVQYHGSDGPESRLTSEIVRLLLTNPDIHKESNEDICHMAAENAIAMHPHLDEAPDLLEAAYALYLELMMP